MRGIAAIVVMLGHYFNGSFLKNSGLAVDFFFILSGFVISHSYAEKLRSGMRPRDYVARRIARLWPLMVLSLCLAGPILAGLSHYGVSDFTGREIALATVSNSLFVPYFNTRYIYRGQVRGEGITFPGDSPMWSIFFEFFVSLLFLWLIRCRLKTLVRLAVSAFLLCVMWGLTDAVVSGSCRIGVPLGWNSETFVSGFPRVIYGFVCGMVLHEISNPDKLQDWIRKLPKLHPFLLYLALIASLAFPYELRGLYFYLTVGVVAPILILVTSRAVTGPVLTPVSEFLGWLSYPLYCLHSPAMMGLTLLAFHNISFPGMAPGTAGMLAALLLSILVATILDWLKIQKRLAAFLNRSSIQLAG